MKRIRGLVISASLAMCAAMAEAQAPTGSILHVEFLSSTLYVRGYCGPADRGQDPNKLPKPRVTPPSLGIADIVSVNGQPVKGTAIENVSGTMLSPNFTPGRAVGDYTGNATNTSWELTFLNLDGSLIGTLEISGQGTSADLRPPGAPIEFPGGSVNTVTAGTGPFFGVRGYFAPVQDTVSPERQTTDCEDPAYRRINADAGGNKRHPVLFLVPVVPPQVLATANSPAVVHADRTLVTPANPAKAGETLTLFATGLGPTRPGVDPGQPFTTDPLQVVNSPVQVLVNGNPSDALYAAGFPGTADQYWVDFRVPAGTTPGQASLQVSSAWMAGPSVNIAVQ
jgi:hypothetical protein